MIDVHCHLNLKGFEKDIDNVIQRAIEAGVSTIINTGTSLESSKKAVELTEKYNNLYAIVGVHPHHADKVTGNWIDELEKIARHKKVVGIGEIGMDYYNYSSNGVVNKDLQQEIFEAQINLAHKLNLPLQIHNRQAGEDVVRILEKNKTLLLPTPGMFHCFAATQQILEKIIAMGFYVGFDGNLTYAGIAKGESVPLTKLCELTPLNRIVVETDAPFLTPEPHRGSRNEPSYVIITGRKIAEIKGISVEEIEKITTDNTKTLFNI